MKLMKLVSAGGVRVLGLLFGFLFSLAITHSLPVEEVGYFFSAYAIVVFATVFWRFGLSTYILKLSSTDESGDAFHVTLSAMGFLALVGSSVVAVVWFSSIYFDDYFVQVLCWSAPGFVFLMLLTVLAAYFQGRNRFVWSVFSLNVMYQAFFVVIAMSFVYFIGVDVDAVGAAKFFSIGSFGAFMVSFFVLLKGRQWCDILGVKGHGLSFLNNSRSLFNYWLVALGGQWLLWGAQIIGAFTLEEKEIAMFGVAQRLAVLALFCITVINLVYQPKYSRLKSENESAELEEVIKKTFVVSFSLGFPLVLFVFFFGDWLLLIFGEEYLGSGSILNILLAGVLVAYILGPSSSVLLMVGREKKVSYVSLLASLYLLVVGSGLSYLYGVVGMAYALASTYFVQYILNFYFLAEFRKSLVFERIA